MLGARNTRNHAAVSDAATSLQHVSTSPRSPVAASNDVAEPVASNNDIVEPIQSVEPNAQNVWDDPEPLQGVLLATECTNRHTTPPRRREFPLVTVSALVCNRGCKGLPDVFRSCCCRRGLALLVFASCSCCRLQPSAPRRDRRRRWTRRCAQLRPSRPRRGAEVQIVGILPNLPH